MNTQASPVAYTCIPTTLHIKGDPFALANVTNLLQMLHAKLKKKKKDKKQFCIANESKYEEIKLEKGLPVLSRWEPEPVQSNLPGRPFDQSYSWNFRSKSKQVLSNFVPLYYYNVTCKALQAKELTNSAIQAFEYHENWKYDIQSQGTAGIWIFW